MPRIPPASVRREAPMTAETMLRREVTEAFPNTPKEYLEALVARVSPGSVGSVFSERPRLTALRDAAWRPLMHPAVSPPYRVLRAELPGELGVVDLKKLYPEVYLKLRDRLGIGVLEPEAILRRHKRPPVDYATLVIGPDPETGLDRIWSFQPGDPNPLLPRRKRQEDGDIFTARELLDMGYSWANVATS